jgi:hypothetical protein
MSQEAWQEGAIWTKNLGDMENNPTKKNMYVREKYTIWLFNLAEENA